VLRAYLRLSGADRRLVWEAFALVAAMRIALRTTTFEAVRRLALRLEKPKASAASPERIAWAVEAAGRRIPGATCLAKALAARVMLGRRGLESRLKLGVAREGEGITAHAWVEHAGRVVVGASALEYAPLT